MSAQTEIRAFEFDGAGKGQAMEDPWAPLAGLQPKAGFVWVHLNFAQAVGDRRDWLAKSGLDGLVQTALSAPETRPRCTVHDEGVVMNLRGVNLSPGADPEDMVSLRMWITAGAVVTVQMRPLFAVRDVIEGIERGQCPDTPGELVARLALRLADRAEPVVAELNERIDTLEDKPAGETGMRGELADIRRVSIMLRRYMFPQRDALSTFEIEDLAWLTVRDRIRLREATERVTRLAEELDQIRDRAQVVHDMIMDQRAEAMNRQMLILSVVAAIFLPLGLLTGLLGINVGGMPGANTPWAFWVVCGLLVVICAFQLWLFRRLGLIGK